MHRGLKNTAQGQYLGSSYKAYTYTFVFFIDTYKPANFQQFHFFPPVWKLLVHSPELQICAQQ